MTITLCGANAFAIRQRLAALVDTFVASHGANAVERLDSESLTLPHLREQVSAVSLFAPERMLILKDASANKELFGELGDIAASTPEGVTLVIVEGNLDKRTKTYKTLKAKTDFREYVIPSDGELQKWIASEVKEKGGQIDSSAARLLLEMVGGDQWQLAGEIQKLIAWDKKITSETIQKLVTPNLELSAFALLDAVMAGRESQSRELLAQMKTRSDPYEFFGLLVWQVHAVAVVAAAGHADAASIGQKTNLKPFVVQKSQQLARRLGTEKVKRMVEQIATLDVQLKSSGVEPWVLIEQSLAKVSSR